MMEESVEEVKTVFQERTSERICEQGGVIEVSKISSQYRILQHTRQTPVEEVEARRSWLSAGKDGYKVRANELEGLLEECA